MTELLIGLILALVVGALVILVLPVGVLRGLVGAAKVVVFVAFWVAVVYLAWLADLVRDAPH